MQLRCAAFLVIAEVLFAGFVAADEIADAPRAERQIYRDVPFPQKLATVYRSEVPLADYALRSVRVDRDGKVLITTDRTLLKAYDGRIVPYREYAGIADLQHHDLKLLGGKFVFLNTKMLLPLHGAGRDYVDNQSQGFVRVAPLAGGHYVLLSDAKIVELKNGEVAAEHKNPGYRELLAMPELQAVALYGDDRIALFREGKLSNLPHPDGKITGVVEVNTDSDEMQFLVATEKGLFQVDEEGVRPVERKLPVNELACITRDATGRIWIGSTRGAFSFHDADRIHYYAGRRWLADDRVIDITSDGEGNVYLLNAEGLTKLAFQPMTLADKAEAYQRHLRQNHIRFGFVSDINLPEGDYAHVRLHDSDNDGLWSSMYLAAECYRYAVTGDDDALENALDGLDALERLVTINPIPGFQARSFELDGFKVSDKDRWRTRPERDFEWKGHTSSDELVGTFFCYAVMWDTIGRTRPEVCERIATLVGETMSHILDNDLYLIDIDGEPTLWGRWHPEYVNTERVGGDRRLNSVEILAFLQLAYHMTGDERYREQFLDLVNKHGYAENTVNYLPNPRGPWNHSDDELYWLSYYNLLQNVFEPSVKELFLQSAREHRDATSRKRNPVWNFIFGGLTSEEIDLEGSVGVLRDFPLDLRRWRMENSHRGDIEFLPRPRRRAESVALIPPDERAITKWNSNEMAADGGSGSGSAESGAEFLLPYWMGRYFGYISEPQADTGS